MAYQGTLFTNANVTTPICCGDRVSFFSGYVVNRHDINDFIKDFTDSAWANNHPVIIRNNGYYNGFIGKYGVSLNRNDDEFDYWKVLESQGLYFYKDKNGNPIHDTDLLADEALRFLNIRDQSKPFFFA
jgi:arylsulfatase A-like enzyme